MDSNHPMNSVNSPNMSLQFDLNYDDSSFGIHKLPHKGKPSEYLLKDPPALPDFSTSNKILTPKQISLNNKQLDQG